MTAGTLTSKTFKTLNEAMMFSVYRVVSGNVYSIDKV